MAPEAGPAPGAVLTEATSPMTLSLHLNAWSAADYESLPALVNNVHWDMAMPVPLGISSVIAE